MRREEIKAVLLPDEDARQPTRAEDGPAHREDLRVQFVEGEDRSELHRIELGKLRDRALHGIQALVQRPLASVRQNRRLQSLPGRCQIGRQPEDNPRARRGALGQRLHIRHDLALGRLCQERLGATVDLDLVAEGEPTLGRGGDAHVAATRLQFRGGIAVNRVAVGRGQAVLCR